MMKNGKERRCLVFLLTGLFCLSAKAQTGPQIQFEFYEVDTTVVRGEPILYIFPYQNVGDETLIVTDIDGKTGNLYGAPRFNLRRPVPPGGRDTVFFRRMTECPGCAGLINDTITITCNDTTHAPPKLTLSGEVLWPEKTGAITFDYTSYDMGTVIQGGNGNFKYPFQNTGSGPLIISIVKTSTGSMMATYNRAPILPGEWDTIYVKYDVTRVGPVNRTITVSCNDPAQEQVFLRLTGKVLPAPVSILAFSPVDSLPLPISDFNQLEIKTNWCESYELILVNPGGLNLDLVGFSEFNLNAYKANLTDQKATIEPGKSEHLVLSFDGIEGNHIYTSVMVGDRRLYITISREPKQ